MPSVNKSVKLNTEKHKHILDWLDSRDDLNFNLLVISLLEVCMDIGPAPKNEGFIYLIQRDDGVYKFGKSTNPKKRFRSLASEYGSSINVRYLAFVDDMDKAEKIALDESVPYTYTEGRRVELRVMNSVQVELCLGKVKDRLKDSGIAILKGEFDATIQDKL